jgi:hypothetical protein
MQWKDIQCNERTGIAMKGQARQWKDRQNNERTGNAMTGQAMWWKDRQGNERTGNVMAKRRKTNGQTNDHQNTTHRGKD